MTEGIGLCFFCLFVTNQKQTKIFLLNRWKYDNKIRYRGIYKISFIEKWYIFRVFRFKKTYKKLLCICRRLVPHWINNFSLLDNNSITQIRLKLQATVITTSHNSFKHIVSLDFEMHNGKWKLGLFVCSGKRNCFFLIGMAEEEFKFTFYVLQSKEIFWTPNAFKSFL